MNIFPTLPLKLLTFTLVKAQTLIHAHKMNRRAFLSRPVSVLSPKRKLSGLNPYSGTWDVPQIKHLLKRTMFGATKADIDYFKTKTMSQAVDELLATGQPVPAPPLNAYSTSDTEVAFGQTWVTSPYPPANPLFIGPRLDSLRAWMIGNMLNQNRSIMEKLILFWSNHFAVTASEVGVPQAMYDYQHLIRQYALGNFKTLTKAMTKNPAMLRFLNGYLNTKTAPDENYARELQELFTVGKGSGSGYTEDDVKAAARVLTGYRINPLTTPISYYFDPTAHDTGNKQFSAFYGNTVIQGQGGANGENELDALLNMIFNTSEVAKHLCRRLYQFFVYYKIDAQVETDVITPMADLLLNNNYEVLPALSALFKSQHFYDIMQRDCIIKNPLDLFVGMCREFDVQFPTAASLEDQYNAWFYITSQAGDCHLLMLNPDNVSGYLPYYQIPMMHELWITADTLPKRTGGAENLMNGVSPNTFNLKIDPVAFTESLPNPQDPYVLIEDVALYLCGIGLGPTAQAHLLSILLSGQTDPSYWTDAWADYVSNPGNMGFYNIVYTRLKSFYTDLMAMEEYQLS